MRQKIDITLKEIKQDAITQLVNLVNKKLEYYDKHNIKLSAFYLSSMMKEALHELGYEDYFYGDGLVMIEWANLIEEILPETRNEIFIEKNLEKGFDYRKITIKEVRK